MADHIPLPAKQYSVIYADPPWAYQQAGATAKACGTAVKHYPTMTTAEICALPVREIVRGGRPALCGRHSPISRRPSRSWRHGAIKTDEPRTLDFSGVRGFLVTNVCIVQRSAA